MRYNIIKSAILVYSSVLILTCSDSNSTAYRYYNELESYLLKHHRIRIKDESELYLLIIPIGGCSPCVKESLGLAVKQKSNKKLKTLFLADNIKQYLTYQQVIEELDSERVFIEKAGNDNGYELGIFSPVLFKIVKGKITYFKELNSQNIHVASREVFGD